MSTPRASAVRKRIVTPGDRMADDLFSELFTPQKPLLDLSSDSGEDQGRLKGNNYTIPQGTTAQDPAPGPFVPDQGEEKTFTVSFQLKQQPTTTALLTPPQVIAVITYGQGQGTFTKGPIMLRGGGVQKFLIVARQVTVNFYYTNGNPITNKPITVAASVVEGDNTGPNAYAWTWADSIEAGSGILAMGALQLTQANFGASFGACLGQYRAILAVAATGNIQVWLMFFDIAALSQLSSGNTLPLPGGRGAQALQNVGDWTDYGDEFMPGGIAVSQGLGFALSSNPYIYTTPAGAPIVVLDAKVGT